MLADLQNVDISLTDLCKSTNSLHERSAVAKLAVLYLNHKMLTGQNKVAVICCPSLSARHQVVKTECCFGVDVPLAYSSVLKEEPRVIRGFPVQERPNNLACQGPPTQVSLLPILFTPPGEFFQPPLSSTCRSGLLQDANFACPW